MRGKIAVGLALALLGVGARQRQRNDGRLAQTLHIGGAVALLVGVFVVGARVMTAWADSTP